MAKSVLLTYLFWLFGGVFGLHHFYLGRDRQAFIWWCLMGGYMIGWLRDIYKIPSYVAEANFDQEYIKKLTKVMRKNKKPPWSLVRSFAQILVGNSFGYMFLAAIPLEEYNGINFNYLVVLVPFATAVGVHIVGNVGPQEGKLLWPTVGAYCVLPFYYFDRRLVGWSAIIGTGFFNRYSLEWRRRPKHSESVFRRSMTLTLCGLLWMGLWTSYIYFNLEITDREGTKIKFRDAMGNFFKSPVFQDFKKNMIDLWNYGWQHGWGTIFRQLSDRLDPFGEHHALRVLELSKGASQEEIKTRWKHLSRRYHPDKYTSSAEKQKAEQRFVEIQDAYEKLSEIKARRAKQNSVHQQE